MRGRHLFGSGLLTTTLLDSGRFAKSQHEPILFAVCLLGSGLFAISLFGSGLLAMYLLGSGMFAAHLLRSGLLVAWLRRSGLLALCGLGTVCKVSVGEDAG